MAQRMKLSYKDLCDKKIDGGIGLKDQRRRSRRPTLASILDADDDVKQVAVANGIFDSQQISHNHLNHMHIHVGEHSSAPRLVKDTSSTP